MQQQKPSPACDSLSRLLDQARIAGDLAGDEAARLATAGIDAGVVIHRRHQLSGWPVGISGS